MNQNINQEFRILFYPKDKTIYPKRCFLIGAKSLHKYIGLQNANTAFIRALKSKSDKETVKFRKFGTIVFYVK